MMSTDVRKLRVLCCHGYASNAKTFLDKHMKAILSEPKIHDVLDVNAISGPASLECSGGRQRAWWLFNPAYPMDRTLQPSWWAQTEVEYVHAQGAIEELAGKWHRGNYDGVLGFSQGAVAAAMLCAWLERTSTSGLPHFAILCCGFRVPLPTNPELQWYQELATGSLKTPAFIIAGENDQAVPLFQSELLRGLFASASVHVIAKGVHGMPRGADDLAALAAFLQQYRGLPCQSGDPSGDLS